MRRKKKKVDAPPVLSDEERVVEQRALQGDVPSQFRLGMIFLNKAKGEELTFPNLAPNDSEKEKREKEEKANENEEQATSAAQQQRAREKAEAVVAEIRAQQRANNKIRRQVVRQSRQATNDASSSTSATSATSGADRQDVVMSALLTAAEVKNRGLRMEGVQWLLKSHGAGHQESTVALGNVMYENILNGEGGVEQLDKVVTLWRSAVPQRDACFNLGKLYYDGVETVPLFKVDRMESLKWFQMAADEGDVASQYWLGYTHHVGDSACGVTANGPKALNYLDLASTNGHADATMYLYMLWRNGDDEVGIEVDAERAWMYLETARKQGSDEALNVLADLHFHGTDGIDVDATRALRFYLEAGELGNSDALCSAAAMYHHGLGAEKNWNKSYQLYQLAVDTDNENKEAWRNLASCYYHGHGTKQDVELAKTIMKTVLKDEDE